MSEINGISIRPALASKTAPGNVSRVFVNIIVKKKLPTRGMAPSIDEIKLNILPSSSFSTIFDRYARIPIDESPPCSCKKYFLSLI